MRRRDFIKVISGSAAGWPLAVRAQQSSMPVIGFLGPGSATSDAYRVTAVRQGLKEAGYVEGQNVAIEYRWAEFHYDRLSALASDLADRQVAVIITTGTPSMLAAKAVTSTIPIVFETASDPVQLGVVASLGRPGGNVTGVTQGAEALLPKRLELIHELLPTKRVIALLVNPTDPVLAEPQMRQGRSVANTFGLELHVLNASAEHDFDAVFAKLIELRVGGLVIGGDVLFTSHIDQLATLTLRHAMPTIYQQRQFTAAGGLLSYGPSLTEAHRLVGLYAGRILKGEKPADLPIQQSTKVELFVNLKTAKAIGLEVPQALLARADEVFE